MVVTLSRSRALDSSSWPFRSVIGLYVVAASGPLPAPPVPLPTSRPWFPACTAGRRWTARGEWGGSGRPGRPVAVRRRGRVGPPPDRRTPAGRPVLTVGEQQPQVARRRQGERQPADALRHDRGW